MSKVFFREALARAIAEEMEREPRLFLLGVDFPASLAQRVMVGIHLLLGAGFSGRGFGPRALDAGIALCHGLLNRPEERPAQEKIKKQDDDDRRHSTEEQFAELVCDFHREGKVLRPISWLFLRFNGRTKARNYRIGSAARQILWRAGNGRVCQLHTPTCWFLGRISELRWMNGRAPKSALAHPR